jgi:hypothetical protein
MLHTIFIYALLHTKDNWKRPENLPKTNAFLEMGKIGEKEPSLFSELRSDKQLYQSLFN